jgi:hypothetical protein
MAHYCILRWREIPTSVKARDDAGRRVSRALPDWFGQEVDRVAMREGITASDAYLEAFAWSEEVEQTGAADAVADAVVARLVAERGSED